MDWRRCPLVTMELKDAHGITARYVSPRNKPTPQPAFIQIDLGPRLILWSEPTAARVIAQRILAAIEQADSAALAKVEAGK